MQKRFIADMCSPALASAMLFFVINLAALGKGPTLVGLISDALSESYGVQSLGYAMIVTISGASIWGFVHYLLAAKTLRVDLVNAPN